MGSVMIIVIIIIAIHTHTHTHTHSHLYKSYLLTPFLYSHSLVKNIHFPKQIYFYPLFSKFNYYNNNNNSNIGSKLIFKG